MFTHKKRVFMICGPAIPLRVSDCCTGRMAPSQCEAQQECRRDADLTNSIPNNRVRTLGLVQQCMKWACRRTHHLSPLLLSYKLPSCVIVSLLLGLKQQAVLNYTYHNNEFVDVQTRNPIHLSIITAFDSHFVETNMTQTYPL